MDGTALEHANEAQVIASAQDERKSFAAIYDHYFPRVYNYVRYRVDDAATADDLTSHVFEQALANLRSYQPDRAPFATWLFSIARNAVRDHLRAQRRRRWLSLDALHLWPSEGPQPEQVAGDNETRAAILAAVARLTERERHLIALKFGAGLPNKQIAALMGLSESNVGVVLYRAIHRLQAELSDEE